MSILKDKKHIDKESITDLNSKISEEKELYKLKKGEIKQTDNKISDFFN